MAWSLQVSWDAFFGFVLVNSDLSMLCPAQDTEQAFGALERVVWGCPWELADNFVAAMREGRGRLTLSGPGDPTGRGLGFSFWRDERKVRPLTTCSLACWQARQAFPLLQLCGTSRNHTTAACKLLEAGSACIKD